MRVFIKYNKGGTLFVLAFLFWATFFWLIWSKMLRFEPDGLYAGWVNIWGDWAAHIAYTNFLAAQNSFPPEFPILSGHILSYPFTADFLSSLLVRRGASIIQAMIIPSFLLSIFLVAILLIFYHRILGKAKASVLGVFLFLLNGGLGFLWFLSDLKKQGVGLLWQIPQEYTHIEGAANIEWINIITSEILPQRGFLLALPVSLLIFILLWEKFSNPARVPLWQMFLAGIGAGLLPIIHMHSFAVVLLVSGWTFLLSAKGKRALASWLLFFVPAAILSLWLILTFFPQFGIGHIKFRPGWLADQAQDNFFTFWLKNAGVMLFLPLAGFRILPKKLVLWSFSFWGLFLAGNLFTFQPYDWDNTKFFSYWWLAASGFAAGFLDKLLSKKLPLRVLAISLFILAIAGGAIDVARLTQYQNLKIRMLSTSDLALARWVKVNTPLDSIFLTADNHDNPIAMFSGRKIVLGFPGWLWTYGIDISERQIQIETIYRGEKGALTLLRKLGVDYVVIGPVERNRFKDLNEGFFNKHFPLIFRIGQMKVFAVPPT